MIRQLVHVTRVTCYRDDTCELARPRRPQAPAQIAAIHIRQADVQKDRVVSGLAREQHRLMPVISDIRVVPQRPCQISERLAEAHIIFYKEDAHS
ncbi:protein of unknown function (plasmid) [Caballeronia sp. S22]